jgi:hypothetical protein
MYLAMNARRPKGGIPTEGSPTPGYVIPNERLFKGLLQWFTHCKAILLGSGCGVIAQLTFQKQDTLPSLGVAEDGDTLFGTSERASQHTVS